MRNMHPCHAWPSRIATPLLGGLVAVTAHASPPRIGAPGAPRPVQAVLPPGTLALSPAGFTIGGKPVAWGGTTTISRADTSRTQIHQFVSDNVNGGWMCIFDWSVDVHNGGAGTTALYYQVVGQVPGQTSGPITFGPGQAGGVTLTARNWVGLKPGTHAFTIRLTGFHSYTDNTTFTQEVRQATIDVAGSCDPRPDVALAPSRLTTAVPANVAERLRKAGLEPADPKLAAKLKLLAAQVGEAYLHSHVESAKLVRIGRIRAGRTMSAGAGPTTAAATIGASPVGPGTAGSGGGGGGGLQGAGVERMTRLAAVTLPVQGTIVGVFGDQGKLLGADPTLSTTAGTVWPGRYFVQVRTSTPVAVKGGPMFSWGTTTFSLGCTPQFGVIMAWAGAADDPNFIGGTGLASVPSGNGSYNYYVGVDLSELPVGQVRLAQLALGFENVTTGQVPVTLTPDQGEVTIDVTVDHNPTLTGLPYIYPWGGTGLTAKSASLANPGTERIGLGDWQTQTSGDDLVGVGVQLGPGWKVSSAAVASAVSALTTNDTSPDNSWRGAAVTTGPQGGDLRTAVHWHYSGIDSLDYTLEWKLTGPAGQRPLLTMQKYGSCDS